jgi:DNA-binding LacI/PurR family transcriptional regulator
VSVTIKEIARSTGLSIPTVGNVLGRAAHNYSEATRARVLKAAKELGYMPNSSARAIRRGRFDCAALVLSRSKQQTHSYIPPGLLDGLDEELAHSGMHLTVSRLSDEELTDQAFLPKVLRQYMADGMIVNYTHEIPPKMLELIQTHHTPAVWTNNKLESDCVFPDDLKAAGSATQQFIELGHQRIVLLHMNARLGRQGTLRDNWTRMHYSTIDRAQGYTGAMRSAGLAPRIVSHEQFIEESEHIEICTALLRGEDRPTAVLAYSENEVHSLICAARMLGLEIPRQLSVAVFAPVTAWIAGYQVGIVALPTAEIGRQAVQMLQQKIKSPSQVCKPVPVPYGLVAHQTVARAER